MSLNAVKEHSLILGFALLLCHIVSILDVKLSDVSFIYDNTNMKTAKCQADRAFMPARSLAKSVARPMPFSQSDFYVLADQRWKDKPSTKGSRLANFPAWQGCVMCHCFSACSHVSQCFGVTCSALHVVEGPLSLWVAMLTSQKQPQVKRVCAEKLDLDEDHVVNHSMIFNGEKEVQSLHELSRELSVALAASYRRIQVRAIFKRADMSCSRYPCPLGVGDPAM